MLSTSIIVAVVASAVVAVVAVKRVVAVDVLPIFFMMVLKGIVLRRYTTIISI